MNELGMLVKDKSTITFTMNGKKIGPRVKIIPIGFKIRADLYYNQEDKKISYYEYCNEFLEIMRKLVEGHRGTAGVEFLVYCPEFNYYCEFYLFDPSSQMLAVRFMRTVYKDKFESWSLALSLIEDDLVLVNASFDYEEVVLVNHEEVLVQNHYNKVLPCT